MALRHLSRPDHREMVGRLVMLAVLANLTLLAQGQDCSKFKKEYCNLQLDKIMMLDTNMQDPSECQTACFERGNCTQFTFFSGANKRCVLFSQCSSPITSCKGCLSGPPWPRVKPCAKKENNNKNKGGSGRRSGRPRSAFQTKPLKTSNGPTRPVSSRFEGSFRSGGRNVLPKSDPDSKDYGEDGSFDDYNDKKLEKAKVDDGLLDEEEEEDGVSIDDGLLDEVFKDLPGTGTVTSPPPKPTPRRTVTQSPKNKTNCPTCPGGGGFYYCVMGGRDKNGPVSSVSVMNIGTYKVPRRPLISSFPLSMTRGNGRTFSVYSGNSLHTCTPGYPVTTLTPASTFHGFGTNFFGARTSFTSGTCNGYNFGSRQWAPTGGQMTSARQGGSTLNVGSYIMSLGGFNPFGQPVTSVDIFDPRRPKIGWQNVPQWSFPRATRDMCTVVNKDPKLGTQIMTMGGLGEEHSVMKLVLSTNNWFSVPPMNFPRTQHGCSSITLNGRPGVVVSGGVDSKQLNTTSVEFFDINTHKWINLPALSRGRRGHTMTTIEGQLAVAGGAALGHEGDIEYLDDVEVFDGRRWKRANYGIGKPRDGANLIKIPFSTFGSSPFG